MREVPGPNCQEVESALALIVALMVDPLAASSDRVHADLAEPPGAAAPSAPAAKSDWSLRLEQRVSARTAIAPSLTWGQGVGLMVTSEKSWLRSSLSLSGNLARGTTSQPEGSAEFEWAAAQLAVCPVGLQPRARWDVRACGIFQAGRLRGSGFQTISPAAKSIFWSAVGLQLEGRFELVGPLWLGLEGALELPFSREQFYLEPQQRLHRVPPAGGSLGLGLGVRFF